MASTTCTFVDSSGVERYAGTLVTTGAGAFSVDTLSATTSVTAPAVAGTTSVTTPLVKASVAATGVKVADTGDKLGFYGTAPVSLQTGVAVSAAGIHAALVSLGLITA